MGLSKSAKDLEASKPKNQIEQTWEHNYDQDANPADANLVNQKTKIVSGRGFPDTINDSAPKCRQNPETKKPLG